MNKKAVSPLVATVLLIAFAVSLGAVIMNWTVDNGVEEGDDTTMKPCEPVSISVLNRESEKAICLDRERNKIVIDIENGNAAIDGIRFSYISKASNFIDYSKNIEAGVLSHIELDYDPALYGELHNIKLVPFIEEKDTLYCTTKGQSFSIIEDCK